MKKLNDSDIRFLANASMKKYDTKEFQSSAAILRGKLGCKNANRLIGNCAAANDRYGNFLQTWDE